MMAAAPCRLAVSVGTLRNDVAEQFRQKRLPPVDRLSHLPSLFMGESSGEEVCHVGTITRVRIAYGVVPINSILDREVPPLTNASGKPASPPYSRRVYRPLSGNDAG